jgi:hypothetical protein
MLQDVADSNIRHVLFLGRLAHRKSYGPPEFPILPVPAILTNKRGFLIQNLTKSRLPCVLALEAPI